MGPTDHEVVSSLLVYLIMLSQLHVILPVNNGRTVNDESGKIRKRPWPILRH
jgi:hypothetical protein